MAVNLTEGKDLEGSASYVEVLHFVQDDGPNMTIFKRGGLSRDVLHRSLGLFRL